MSNAVRLHALSADVERLREAIEQIKTDEPGDEEWRTKFNVLRMDVKDVVRDLTALEFNVGKLKERTLRILATIQLDDLFETARRKLKDTP